MHTLNKDVVYYFDEQIGTFNYGNHPMKPFRIAMTDTLIKSYKMDQMMSTYNREFVESHIMQVNEQLFTPFHSQEYCDLIKILTPQNRCDHEDQLYRFNLDDETPVLDRLYDYCLTYTSGTVSGASIIGQLNKNIVINWSGGLHHAKQSEASGFCYINDCVLGILELLKYYDRVLYLDIDIHHGDGVEEAFYLTDRVMTCSFHKFKDFFPGTGHIQDIGEEKGKYSSVNVPLNEGMTDESFEYIFKPVMDKINEKFRPSAVVMQCGTDSLSGDRLGCFNLSIKGHGFAVNYWKDKNIPIIYIGGGGYTLRNISRCWTYETGLILNYDLENQMPEHDYLYYFGPEFKLHLPVSNMENLNKNDYLDECILQIQKNLDQIQQPEGISLSNYNSQPIRTDAQEQASYANDIKEEKMIDQNQDHQ